MRSRASALGVALAVFAALPGCALGFGGARVGQWRARDRVDVDACLVDEHGICADHKQIVSHEPERTFWGAMLEFPAAGASAVTADRTTTPEPRVETSLEILRGHGGTALGGRMGRIFDGDVDAVPAMALEHLALTDRIGVYGGPGLVPWAARVHADGSMTTTNVGARALVGVQIALSRHTLFGVESDAMWLHLSGGYRSFGLTGHLGVVL
jgi:hypothetical protein